MIKTTTNPNRIRTNGASRSSVSRSAHLAQGVASCVSVGFDRIAFDRALVPVNGRETRDREQLMYFVDARLELDAQWTTRDGAGAGRGGCG